MKLTYGFRLSTWISVSSHAACKSHLHKKKEKQAVLRLVIAYQVWIVAQAAEADHHYCSCRNMGSSLVPRILLRPMTDSVATEDTRAQTTLSQESYLMYSSTDARHMLRGSEEKAERNCFALVLCRNILLTRSWALGQGPSQSCTIMGTHLPLRHQLLCAY